MQTAAQRRTQRIAGAAGLSVAVAIATAGAAFASTGSQPSATPQGLTALAGTTADFATPTTDQGPTAAATQLSIRVYLTGQDAAGLAAFAQAVSDPNSNQYHRYLSAPAAEARFGPTGAHTAAVTAWLTGTGLTVASTTSHWIDVTGSAATVQKAFATSLHNYKTVKGTLRGAQHNAAIPAALAGAVSGISGLSQASIHATTDITSAGNSKPGATLPSDPSCSSYFGQKLPPAGLPAVPAGYSHPTTLAQCSVIPSELRQSYGVTRTKLTGKGATIAIVNWYGSPTMEADANQYSSNHGDQPFAPGQYSEVSAPSQWTNQAACGFGDFGEESLDVEMAHGLAPDAKVITIAANSCFDADLLAAEANIVDKHLADIVSNSWGESIFSTAGDLDPAIMTAYDQIFAQGAVEGIAFDVSSGDCMNNDAYSVSTGLNCDPTVSRASVDWPASSKWVTSVGGTALAVTKNGSYSFETAMGDVRSGRTAVGATAWAAPAGAFGGGGGVSETIKQPWYQSWIVPRKLSTTLMSGAKAASPMRTIPDISMNGDLYFSSTVVGETTNGVYTEGGFGGTSVSAPSWAGILADAQQAQYGIPVGFANPAIYFRAGLTNDVVANPRRAGGTATDSVVFVYPSSSPAAGLSRLITYNADEGLTASRGYDLATGVGSPNALFLRSFGGG